MSAVAKGKALEVLARSELSRMGLALIRHGLGVPGDQGVDGKGVWTFPGNVAFPTVIQCKNTSRPVGVAAVRALEAVVAQISGARFLCLSQRGNLFPHDSPPIQPNHAIRYAMTPHDTPGAGQEEEAREVENPIGILVSGEAGFSGPAVMATQRSERPLALFSLEPASRGGRRLVPMLVNESLHLQTGLRLGFWPSRSGAAPRTRLVFAEGEVRGGE